MMDPDRERLERRVAELTAENEVLRATLQTVPDLMFDLDEHGRYHGVWAREPDLLVAQESLLLGRSVAEVLPAEAAAVVMAGIREALQTGSSRGRSIVISVPLGTRHFELSAARGPSVADGTRHVVMLSRDVTERCHAEEGRRLAVEALAASERFARATIDASPSPTCVVDGEGTIVSVNRAWRDFACANGGRPGERSNYLAVCDIATGPDAATARTMASGLRAVLSGQYNTFLLEYPCDGATVKRWFLARVTPFEGEGPARALVEHLDITDRKVLERRLLQAQAQAHIGNWELDLTENRLWWSDELHRIFEIEPDAFGASYEAFLDAVHPDDRARVDAAYAASLVDRGTYRITHRILMSDGRIKFIEERCETEYSPSDGAPLRSWGTALDVTERVRAEDRLVEAQQVAGLGVWDLDLSTQQVWWSDEQYRLNGIEVGTPVGQDLFLSQVHPEDLDAFSGAFAAALTEGKWAGRYRIVRPDGAVRYMQGTANVTRNAAGAAVRMSGTNLDVTSRHLAEERVAASLREKETLVREVHHRVKNNLQIMSSLLHFQARQVTDPDTLAMFDVFRDRLRSMSLVHEQLYRSDDLSRVDVGDYLRALAIGLSRTYRSTGATLNTHVEGVDLRLSIKVVLPVGMLVNELLTNAFKHAFPGGRSGAVRLGVQRTGDALVLAVEDDGLGLVVPAASAESSTFGLQLVHNLVRQLGATIEFSPGPGTQIVVRVPVSHDEASNTDTSRENT